MIDIYLKFQKLQEIKKPVLQILDEEWIASVFARYGDGVDAVCFEQRNKIKWIKERNEKSPICNRNFNEILTELEPELSNFSEVQIVLETIGIPHTIGYMD